MKVAWLPTATRDLLNIRNHIAQDDLRAADNLTRRIRSFVLMTISKRPLIGRPGRVAGTREGVVHRNYIVVYRIHADRIEILSIRHTAQLWPDTFG